MAQNSWNEALVRLGDPTHPIRIGDVPAEMVAELFAHSMLLNPGGFLPRWERTSPQETPQRDADVTFTTDYDVRFWFWATPSGLVVGRQDIGDSGAPLQVWQPDQSATLSSSARNAARQCQSQWLVPGASAQWRTRVLATVKPMCLERSLVAPRPERSLL